MLLLASLPAIAQAQTALPPDIHPVTLSRLPPVTPEDLDEEGRKLLSERPAAKPGRGPRTSRVTAPGSAASVSPRVWKARSDRVLPACSAHHREEIDQQYEWSAHEPAGLRQGLEQSVIDVVKYNRDVKGLADKDATFITFGRTLYREHRVSSEPVEKMIGHFGRQHTVQLMMIMGDYFRVGFMMNAVDQHLPPERKALLPPLSR